jgi:sn-glycerol 3-phosphate transport system ATP-binding protein
MNLLPGRIAGPGVVETGGGRIGFAPDAFAVAEGQAVEIGIRPEDLQFSPNGAGELKFTKDFVEELGATRLIHGTAGNAPLVLAVAATGQVDSGTEVTARPDAVHLFDPSSGASLRGSTGAKH